MKYKKAFTLIELLIVIAIIGVLAGIVLVNMGGAKLKANDSVRLMGMKSIQSALEVYYATYGHYPISGSCGSSIPNAGWCNSVQGQDGNGHWLREGASTLSAGKDPIDPKQGAAPIWIGSTYYYFSSGYGGSGQWYMLIVPLENPANSLQDIDGVTACDGRYFHYGTGSDGVLTVGGNCVK